MCARGPAVNKKLWVCSTSLVCTTVRCELEAQKYTGRAGEYRDHWCVLGGLVCIRQVACIRSSGCIIGFMHGYCSCV